ncbi:polysaccharide lyase [Sphingomonas sp. IC-56]|uniref:heparin lyase I family protein n=1 Tax=Sphingomonas sp. IC-56 TaxID=2898529 RepID=UPI001E57D83B|nr:heparin lyase I family protein [Sphingomonas sp. IC-56]MCD2324336.1 polysaccharide lyase [Sphingomonas sp. IC-56]
MKRALAAVVVVGLAAGAATLARSQAQPQRGSFADNFDAGLCVGSCGGPWAIKQEVRGTVRTAPAPGRPGQALLARAAPKSGGVAKADVVARLTPLSAGTRMTIAFDLRVPTGTPLDSLQLVDLECASCGEGGNPGIRLYLRRGRLRIDRSKIGIQHAWTRDDAQALIHDRWHRIVWQVRLGAGDDGQTRVTLDGNEVLAARGATLASLPRLAVDRVQIGITANSNPVPATAWFDNVRVTVSR